MLLLKWTGLPNHHICTVPASVGGGGGAACALEPCKGTWIRPDWAPGPILSTLFTENGPHNILIKLRLLLVMSAVGKLKFREVR